MQSLKMTILFTLALAVSVVSAQQKLATPLGSVEIPASVAHYTEYVPKPVVSVYKNLTGTELFIKEKPSKLSTVYYHDKHIPLEDKMNKTKELTFATSGVSNGIVTGDGKLEANKEIDVLSPIGIVQGNASAQGSINSTILNRIQQTATVVLIRLNETYAQSPVVKNVKVYLNSAVQRVPSLNNLLRFRRAISTRRTDTEVRLHQALRVAGATGLKMCVARAICELTCSPKQFGESGNQVFRTLIKLQLNRNLGASEDYSFYQHAGAAGRRLKSSHQDCRACYDQYPGCPADTQDLIDISSMITL